MAAPGGEQAPTSSDGSHRVRLPAGLARPSLARRLTILAVGWSFAALVIAAVVLALLFQQAALRRFDAGLSDLIDNLISGSTIEAGEVVAPALTDQRALRAYSGRYWDIAEPAAGGGVRSLVPSRSLWDSSLKIPADLPKRLKANPRRPIAFDAPGVQAGERLRVVARWTSLPGRDAPLVFRAWDPRDPLVPDALGVPAPPPSAPGLHPDLVITPLLAFDRKGGRLGQGGGHYDRTLESLRAARPVFVLGLAYAGQEVEPMALDPHDQRLDAILTETGYREV